MKLFQVSGVMLLAWGALAFGAEYSWAYAPLLVFSAVVGALGLLAGRRRSAGPDSQRSTLAPTVWALAVVFLAGLVQLVPLPRGAVATVSPGSLTTDYARLYAESTMRASSAPGRLEEGERDGAREEHNGARALSIAPTRTALGLVFLATLTFLLTGCARAISVQGPRGLVRGVVVLGAVVALVSIVQRAVGTETVYGFWYPPNGGVSSAPFINPNHTAGWLVMAMSLATGWFAGSVARGFRDADDWRRRILWFSSPEAGETMLTGLAIAIMALSIMLTASRGGLLCLVAATALSAWWAVWRQSSRTRALVAVAYLALVFGVAASWGRMGAVLREFGGATPDIGGRLEIWQDAVQIVRDFPLTGTGLNTYGVAMLHYQTLDHRVLYIEAHNDYLQLAAEGGLLLGVPILVALGLFVREVWRRFREERHDRRIYWLRAGAVTGLGAIAFQEFFDFTLQMPGAAVLFVVLAAIAIHRPPEGRSRQQRAELPEIGAVELDAARAI